jgi:hypothetical protein
VRSSWNSLRSAWRPRSTQCSRRLFRSAQLLGDRLWHWGSDTPKAARGQVCRAASIGGGPWRRQGRAVSGVLQAIAETVRQLQIGVVVGAALCRGMMWSTAPARGPRMPVPGGTTGCSWSRQMLHTQPSRSPISTRTDSGNERRGAGDTTDHGVSPEAAASGIGMAETYSQGPAILRHEAAVVRSSPGLTLLCRHPEQIAIGTAPEPDEPAPQPTT